MSACDFMLETRNKYKVIHHFTHDYFGENIDYAKNLICSCFLFEAEQNINENQQQKLELRIFFFNF